MGIVKLNLSLKVCGYPKNRKNKGDIIMIKINGAWYIDSMPNYVVVEDMEGNLSKFYLTPFRALKDKDFTVYNGYHPRKCKGQPLPKYLYKFYGLEKNSEALTEVVKIRVTPSDLEKLQGIAQNNNKTVSEFIRTWVKSL